MAWIRVEGWRAGRAWSTADGKLSFYVRRNGKDHPTGATTLAGALAALERFEKTGDVRPPEAQEPVFLDVELAKVYLAASKAKGNSVSWRRNQKQHLDWWETKIGGRDLRAGSRGAVSIADVRAALDGATSARQREAVLRSLYAFLRGGTKVGDRAIEFTAAEDPTYGKPHIVPPGRPAQETVDKAIDDADLETVLGYLDALWAERAETDEDRDKRGRRWGDLLRLLDGTGMHVTEAARFAEAGTIEPLPAGRKATKSEAGVLVVPLHKSGAPYRVAVSKATLAVAKRVRDAGPFSIAVFYAELRKAKKKTGAEGVLPGRFRHTVAKAAVNAGATIEQVGNFLGHKSPATTRKFYATLGVPMKVPTRR
jgi:integrase